MLTEAHSKASTNVGNVTFLAAIVGHDLLGLIQVKHGHGIKINQKLILLLNAKRKAERQYAPAHSS